MASILYICYLGLSEPLVQTQVIPYLAGLTRAGHRVVLLTFDPTAFTDVQRRAHKTALGNLYIEWHSLRYHKRPALPATLVDVMAGILYGAFLIRKNHIDVVHGRSHVGAAVAVCLKWLLGPRVVFDMRGLLAEEYVDAGLWREGGYLYRLTKAIERVLLAKSDALVLLTQRVRQWLLDREAGENKQSPVAVIPCCVDLRRFDVDPAQAQRVRKNLGLDGHPVMVYAGKVGGWYMTREMIDFFRVAGRYLPGLRFLVLTQSAVSMIKAQFARENISQRLYRCLSVSPRDLPAYLSAADFAISFIRPSLSKIASSPTKMAEYLAAGLPVVYNAGIGDLDGLQSDRVGVLVTRFRGVAYRRAARELWGFLDDRRGTALRCRRVAETRFGLATVGVPRYLELYAALQDATAGDGGRAGTRLRADGRMN